MSEIETVRLAARLMRAEHPGDYPRHAFWAALADWLDASADWLERNAERVEFDVDEPGPLAVARAYIGATGGVAP